MQLNQSNRGIDKMEPTVETITIEKEKPEKRIKINVEGPFVFVDGPLEIIKV